MFVIIMTYGKTVTGLQLTLRNFQIDWDRAIKFARWQHPAVWRGARFTVPSAICCCCSGCQVNGLNVLSGSAVTVLDLVVSSTCLDIVVADVVTLLTDQTT